MQLKSNPSILGNLSLLGRTIWPCQKQRMMKKMDLISSVISQWSSMVTENFQPAISHLTVLSSTSSNRVSLLIETLSKSSSSQVATPKKISKHLKTLDLRGSYSYRSSLVAKTGALIPSMRAHWSKSSLMNWLQIVSWKSCRKYRRRTRVKSQRSKLLAIGAAKQSKSVWVG